MKLPRSFYQQPTLMVARELLGKYLVHRIGSRLLVGRIVETEAYVGPEDRASHAWRGRTARNSVMFGPAGIAYVYLVYGMYHCLNVVTEGEGFPAAVLLRAIEPIQGLEGRTDGPGRLCRAMAIDLSMNGLDMTGDCLWAEDRGPMYRPDEVEITPRIGVHYAGEYATKPWRFCVKGNPFVSSRGKASLLHPYSVSG